jgi:tRNA A-37 threonylcarbamoyl transferase component Bud32
VPNLLDLNGVEVDPESGYLNMSYINKKNFAVVSKFMQNSLVSQIESIIPKEKEAEYQHGDLIDEGEDEFSIRAN